MNPLDWDRRMDLFCRALELGPEERIPLLDRACDGSPELLDQVSRMLGAAASEREASYVTAAVPESPLPSSRARLFKLNLVTGSTAEVTISDGILTAPAAVVGVD